MADQRTREPLLRIVVVILAGIVLLPLLMMIFAMPMVGMMGWWWADAGVGWHPLWGIATMLLFLVILIGAGYLLFRAITTTHLATDPALEELRIAYARGDLSDEEFEERRRRLE